MYYNYIKAFHLIFIITWFAGLFYVPRLFMYQIEAYKKKENIRQEFIKQFKLMSWRLWYIITWPSALLASFFGVLLIVINQSLLNQNWMILKIGFVLLLIIYHLKTHMIFLSLQKDKCSYSSNFFRFWNEGATLLLFAIIFLVSLKDSIQFFYLLVGLICLALVLFFSVKFYEKIRKKNE
ncbi:MAG: protoporphyrinogen IX oxidase [Flavobacteriaceae bacterium]|nr:protoporphyrinogen IX oxidase [Flavobacteriaceae bacterium]